MNHSEADTESQSFKKTGKAFRDQLPTIREFVYNEWKDLVSLGVVYGIVSLIPGLMGNRQFPIPMTNLDGTTYSYFSNFTSQGHPSPDVQSLLFNAYPFREQIIPVWLSAFLALVPPLLLFCLFQIRIRSYEDLHASVYGLLTTLVHGTVFQVALKNFIGGLRPYFYDACRPDPAKLFDPTTGALMGTGFGSIMFDISVCTGPTANVRKAMSGWPSGHSNAAMGSAIYVSLYLNAKLKIFADTRGRYWKMFVFFFPIVVGSTLLGSLGLDQSHAWYDILTGGLIGALCAITSYRLRYAALWDFRFNHIPLPKRHWREMKEAIGAETHHADESTSTGQETHPGKHNQKNALWRRVHDHSRMRLVHPPRFPYVLPPIQPAAPPPIPTHAQYPPPDNLVMSRFWQGSNVGAPGDAQIATAIPVADLDTTHIPQAQPGNSLGNADTTVPLPREKAVV